MDVFLDYHGVDVEEARRFAAALRSAGRDVLLDDASVVPERGWLRAVGDQGLRAPFLFLLISPRTPEDWLQSHTRLALAQHAWAERDKRPFTLVPVLTGGRKLDPQKHSSLFRWTEAELPVDPARWAQAVSALAGKLEHWGSSAPLERFAVERTLEAGPFPGLRAFNAARATQFMGRDEDIRQCLQRIDAGARWLQVEGASGVGKTSLVRAGLLVALEVAGQSPFGPSWRHCVVRPGADPTYDLALALHNALDIDADQLPPEELAYRLVHDENALVELVEQDMPRMGHRGLLLVLDQLDDGFTQQPIHPQGFVGFDGLISRALEASPTFRLVTTVRSDRLNGFRTMPRLEAQLNVATTARYHLAPLRDDDLRAIIVDPVHLMGAAVGEGLTEELIRISEDEDLRLPKLAVVLRALWRDAAVRDPMRPVMSLQDFERYRDAPARPAGSLEQPFEGLRNAFSTIMDQSVQGLTEPELEAARDMLVAVVRPGHGGSPDLRCMQQRGYVVNATERLGPQQARKVLYQLAGPVEDRNPTGLEPFRVIESLLASGDSESLDLRHDVLLSEWRLLGAWLEQSREFLERRDELMLLRAKPDPFENGPPAEATILRLIGQDLDDTTKVRYLRALDDDGRKFLDSLRRHRPEPPVSRRVSRTLALVGLFAFVAVGLTAWWAVQFSRRLADDNRMQAVRIATSEVAPSAARVLLSSVQLPERQERWPDDVIAALERPAVKRALVGTGSEILSLDLSPDGTQLVAGAADGSVLRWTIDSVEPVQVLERHTEAVRSVAISPDGQRVVTASHDGTARIIALDGSGESLTLDAHEGPLTMATISPDGLRVATASHDGTARIWRRDGRLEVVLGGHQGWVLSAEFGPDSHHVLTGGQDGKARVWALSPDGNTVAGVRPVILDHGSGFVQPAHFGPSGDQVMTGASNGALRVWTLYEDAPPIDRLLGRHEGGSIISARYDRKGEHIVSTGRDRTVRVWSLAPTEPGVRPRPEVLNLDTTVPRFVQFAPNDRDVLLAVEGGQVWRWRPGDETASAVYGSGATEVSDLAFRSRPAQMVTGTTDGVVRVWDFEQSLVPEAVEPETPIAAAYFPPASHDKLFATLVGGGVRVFDRAAAAFTETVIEGILDPAGVAPNGDQIATITTAGVARIWTIDGSLGPRTVPGDAPVSRIAYSPDGETIAALGQDGVLRLYGARALPSRGTLRLRKGQRVASFAFGPTGDRLVTGGTQGAVSVWSIPPGDVPRKSFELDGQVDAVAMSEDGVVVAGGASGVRVWAVNDPDVNATLDHSDRVRDLAITADGRWVLTRADDRVARLWDVQRPDTVVRRSAEDCSAVQADLLPDGRVAVACGNGPAELWKATGQSMRLTTRGRAVAQVSFSPDGAELITTTDEGPVAIWPASVEQLREALLSNAEPCLTPSERVHFLEEDQETALGRWRGCQQACWGTTFGGDVDVKPFRCPREE